MGMLAAFLGPILALFGTWLGYRMSLDGAQSDPERQFIRSFYRKLTACRLGFFIVFTVIMLNSRSVLKTSPGLFAGLIVGLGLIYTGAIVGLSLWSPRA
jgi:hypothetical protein